MDNNKLIRKTIIWLVLLTMFTILMLTLVGKNGLINREIEEYKATHAEEVEERENKK
ncbi:MAG: hypothetical protein K6B70_06015 [Clostridia bacterium]|nr:hypothetical protein [Clostridia bacterium]